MSDVIRGTAINYINFLRRAENQYQETGKSSRKETALRRIRKFLKAHPEMEEYIKSECKDLGI